MAFRIDDPTAATSLPTPEAAGTGGYFTEGNPSAGTPATLVRASWLNMAQEELVAAVQAAGLTLDKTNRGQLLAAIETIGRGRLQVFTGNGNFAVPTSVTTIKVRMVGGGGGGAGNGNNQSGGGGAGEYREGIFAVTPGTSYTVTVGSGGVGAAGATGNTTGGAGGTTSFGALMSAVGGSGGSNNSSPAGFAGGGGSGGAGGYLAVVGGDGEDGASSNLQRGGNGGASFFGGGCGWGPTAAVGGVGSSGVVIVEW
jgi:hypothetical protein